LVEYLVRGMWCVLSQVKKKNLGNVIDENLARIVPLYDIDIILS